MDVLMVIDMQNDFVDGALGTDEARAIVKEVAGRIRTFDGTVIATMDTHREGYLSTAEGRNLPVPHCVKGTHGWEIVPEVAEALAAHRISHPEDAVYEKYAFACTEMVYDLARDHAKGLSVELIGLCTDICVVMNALLVKALIPEAAVSVDAGACAGTSPAAHMSALATMRSCHVSVQ